MTKFEKIQEIASQVFAVQPEEITLATTFEDLGADSLDLMEMINETETEFDIEISEDSFRGCNNVGDLMNYLKTLGVEDIPAEGKLVGDSSLTHSDPVPGGAALPAMNQDNDFCWRMEGNND